MGKITVVDIVLRLLGAVIVGFAVGAQRARTSHPAGIRTHILVALGSCVVMVTSCILYEQTIAGPAMTMHRPANCWLRWCATPMLPLFWCFPSAART